MRITDEDAEFRKRFLSLVHEDDVKAGAPVIQPRPIEEMLTIGWAVAKNPFLGGEYYRAYRPAALSSRDFGWHTAVIQQIGSVEGSNKVAGAPWGNPQHVIEPDVWIIRPLGKEEAGSDWTLQAMVERCHAAGQAVIADLDDDVWAHEDWTEDREGTDDKFETWCWEVDGWLVSTPYMKERVELIAQRRGKPVPKVLVAPNCFDPVGLGHESHPIPGRRIGTRLWLSGRMSGDLEIYKECYTPLLEELDLTFVHIGKEVAGTFTEGPGLHLRSFANDCDMPQDRLLELGSTTIPEMGKLLGATINIATIAMADQPFNYAKTQTHAVEVAAAGLPIVAATTLSIYKDVPGRIDPTPAAVKERVEYLLEPHHWHAESERSRVWARKTSVRCEALYARALQSMVRELIL